MWLVLASSARDGWSNGPQLDPGSSLNPEMRDCPPPAAATASESKEHRGQEEPCPELPAGVWASQGAPHMERNEGRGVCWLVSIPLLPCTPHCLKTHLFSDSRAS